ncbi:MAG: acyl-CoA synthetase (NDP forming), partial [Halieaceae bacterium]
AAERGKPIVVLKTGRSEAGARIALSHTATLAGGAELYDSLFDRLGVVQVRDLETFLEALRLLSVHGRMRGPRIASMSCSGGEASLLADLAQDTCLEFPDITPDQRVALKETLNDYVVISNPLDYHTFIWGDWARMQQTFTAMLAGNYDLTLLLLDFPTLKEGEVNEWALAGEAFAAACEETGQAGAVVSSLAESMPVAVRESLLARSVVPMLGTQQAVAVIAACAAAREIVQPVPIIPAESQPNPERKSISEHAAKELLGEYGLSAAGAVLVSELDSAVAAADKIGYPVVLKASVEGLSHKTEVGGVVLNVENAEQVREHGRRLLALGGDLLVEKMLSAGVAELLLGISHDSQFGHYLVIGCGGTLVELIADSQLLLLPASDRQIREALGRLRMAKLLQGYRGAPAADIDAIVRSAQGLAALVADQRDTLLEVDINPLIVGAQGSGAMVADALIVYRS